MIRALAIEFVVIDRYVYNKISMAQASKPIMKEIGSTNVKVKNQRADELDPRFLFSISPSIFSA